MPTKGPAIDALTIEEVSRTGYPEPYRATVAGRSWRRLGDAFGLTHFGVNLVRLTPGAASSQRHWHSKEDELVYVLAGTPTLITDAGEQALKPGMVVGFKAGATDGHHLVNRTAEDILFLCVGDRVEDDACDYPDIDMRTAVIDGEHCYVHRDGTPY
jgi:uncharacterized cupin superfamily protein